LTSADLPAIARLIITKSWWDTVDALAISVVGPIVLTDRSAGDHVTDDWIRSDDMWLARAAILHQNKWKTATDEPRLFAFCLAHAAETDFFYRKAIGWALREYSKTAPDAVREFIAAHDDELSGLSKREGMKVLNRGT
jgi:3-methyladenine DNA glycosylase AlkD